VKIVILFILIFLSQDAFACFSPPKGLTEKHEVQAKFAFILGVIFVSLSILLRLYSNKTRLWVPLLVITTYSYYPAYIWHWGQAHSGACGNPEIVLAFRTWAVGMCILLIYELYSLIKQNWAPFTSYIQLN